MRYRDSKLGIVYALCVAVASGLTTRAWAHHSNAPFKLDEVITFDATVVQLEWKNPHVFVHVETVDAAGETIRLQVEGDGLAVLAPLGWSRESLAPGERVRVEANPPRNPARDAVLGRKLTKQDGTVLVPNPEFYDFERARSRFVASGLDGVWLPQLEDFYAYLRSVSSWPLTEKGREYLAAYDGTQNPQSECVSVSAPVIMLYMVHTELDVREDRVVLRSDWMDVERVVYTDGREHPTDGERTQQGHTIGRFEGNALVMDTTLFEEHSGGLVVGVPSGLGKRIVERLTPTEDGTGLIYEFELADPEYLRAPITGTARWDYRPDLVPSASACDLEAARRFLTVPLEQ